MRSEDLSTTIIWAVLFLCVTIIIMTAITQSQMTERVKFQNGYEQQVETYQGLSSPMWRKK